MKKVIYACDLCGWQMVEPWMMFQVEDGEAGERHLCQMCAERIRAAFPQATKAEEPKEEKTKRKRIDQGKVLALAKAGWTVAKIADLMDCSVQTIYNALKTEANALKKEAEE